jgi:hypothetical protein
MCWPNWACPLENARAQVAQLGKDVASHIVRAAITYPAADLKSALYNVESVVGFFPYALYRGAYDVNKWIGPTSVPGVNGALCGLQQLGLHGDEAFDRFQQLTGYPEASEGDEGISVSPIPSFFLPWPGWQDGTCSPYKLVQPWWRVSGPGKHPNGHEDYAGC